MKGLAGFDWDSANVADIARHAVTPQQVEDAPPEKTW
jgi:hypothetical protein